MTTQVTVLLARHNADWEGTYRPAAIAKVKRITRSNPKMTHGIPVTTSCSALFLDDLCSDFIVMGIGRIQKYLI